MERLTIRYNGEKTPFCPPCVKCATSCSECEHLDKMMYKLADYEDAQEQGLLLKLPCKVGNIIYEIEEDRLSSTMKTIEFEGQEYHRHIPNYFINTDIFTLSKIDKFGKTVFLTKEEAEQALKQIGE